MEPNARRDFLLGLVFFGTLALLLYYTIVLTGFSLKPKTELVGWFPDARGLKDGDPVFVAGRDSGTVRDVELRLDKPVDRRIGVRMEFRGDIQLRRGYVMRIAEYSALGGRVVLIDPGPPTAPPLPPDAELLGQSDPPALESLRDLVEENRDDFRELIGNLRAVSDDLASGKGLLGALVSDSGMRDEVATALERIGGVAQDLREGKGALGALVSEPETRDQLLSILDATATTLQDFDELARDIREGEGIFGALISDPTMREDFASLLDNLDQASASLVDFADEAAEGKGLLGRLVKDSELADQAQRLLDDLAETARRLREGEGSMGRLLADDDAYQELLRALQSLNRQLEDAREAQPVTSFAGMLFGSF